MRSIAVSVSGHAVMHGQKPDVSKNMKQVRYLAARHLAMTLLAAAAAARPVSLRCLRDPAWNRCNK